MNHLDTGHTSAAKPIPWQYLFAGCIVGYFISFLTLDASGILDIVGVAFGGFAWIMLIWLIVRAVKFVWRKLTGK